MVTKSVVEYAQVYQSDGPAVDPIQSQDFPKRRRKKKVNRAEWISTKLHAMLWILAAGILIYALDFFHVAFKDPRVNQTSFQIALLCFGVNCCITFYLAIWLPYIRKIHLEWSVYCPRMIPVATGFGVLATVCFIRALWPIWGFFTPGILFVLFIGSLMSAHFLPSI